ncbi:uncharacterized protein [Arachis hypogaea]|uniref:uncharacterized protein n=1 Tax=Arachis hypogaea TaxID=3818 RepID=UPI003B21F731
MKGMEADTKKLFQMFESISEETRAEHARSSEGMNLKIDALQQSITQLLHAQPHHRSELHELSHGSNSGSEFHQRPFMQPRRVGFDLPKFDGSDALGWIFSLDQYFDYFRVPEEEQINIAAIHLTDAAISWFQMSQRSARFRLWNQLKRAIELEFGPSLYESPRELLFKLKQLGTVSNYYSKFVALANRTQIDSPNALKDYFISGLKSDIRQEVKAQCPPSLMRPVTLARLYEDKFPSVSRSTYGPASPRPQPTPAAAISSNRPIQWNTLPPLLPNLPQCPALPPMKSSYMQLQLVLDDADGGDIRMQESLESEPGLEAFDSQVVEHHLSYNAMHGTRGPALIRVNAIINGLEVQALIDGGSSDSFIQSCIAKILNLPIKPASGFKVIVGNFKVLPVEGRIASLDVNLSGCLVSISEVYVLHVAGGELVISSTWSQTLKAHIVDYNSSFLRFCHKGEFVTVQGYKSPPSSQAQFHHIRRLQLDGIVKPPLQLPEALHPTLVSLMQQYVVVFEQPLVKDCFPIPTVDELLDELFGATIFLKLDLRSGYHQILVKPENRFKIAFHTHQGLYEWLVMPFGLTNAPATFQSLMNDIFKPYLCKFVLVFFDDILVYSSGFDLHLEHLELVLKLLQQESLFAKLSKCLFGSPKVDYLGHTIRGGGVHMETAKVQKQSAYIREFYAIAEALAKFRHYLLGKRFILHTDHQSLKALLEQDLHTPEQHKCLHKLLGFYFEIHYKAGTENITADALSRNFFGAWSAPRVEWLDQLRAELVADEDLRVLLAKCNSNSVEDLNYSHQNGLLLWKNRLVVPSKSTLIRQILHEYHDSVIGGLAGITKTVECICSIFYWPHMQKDIRQYVLTCCICQQAKIGIGYLSANFGSTFFASQEGNLVLVKLQPYRQHSVALRKHLKLGLRYFGPFSISKKLSDVAYRVELPPEARIHNFFHILALKRFRGECTFQYFPLPLTTTNVGPVLEPSRILSTCSIMRGDRLVPQCQVQWKQSNLTETTWEDVHHFHKLFPEFNLEDKVVPDGEGNDTNIANEEYISKSEEYINKSQAGLEGRIVTNHGQVAAGPPISDSRKSTREKTNSKWLEDYDH